MATTDKKRKRDLPQEFSLGSENLLGNGVIEVPGDDQQDNSVETDDGEVDEFPELDPASDSEKESSNEEEDDYEGIESSLDEEISNDGVKDASSVFPKPKIVISNITRQPKFVFPEIEPDYDSDSSTEDVCHPFNLIYYVNSCSIPGSQSSGKYSNALV